MFDCYFDNYVKDLEIYDQYENLCRYTGFISDGNKPHGQGILKSPDGSRYTGQWNNGIMHGKATFISSNGVIYQGQWKNGLLDGEVNIKYPDGSKFTGTFVNDEKNGKGTFTYPDGSKYEGEWKDYKLIAIKTINFPDGSKYTSRSIDSKIINSTGTFTDPDNNKYSCNYVDDLENKTITITYCDGSKSHSWKYEIHEKNYGKKLGVIAEIRLVKFEPDTKTSKSDTSSIGTEKPGATISCLPNFVSYLRGRRLPSFSVKHVGGGSALKTMTI